MRIVCPYTLASDPGMERGLHPLCEAALAAHAPDAEMLYLGTRHDSYRDLLADLWAAGDSFLLIEHDVEIHDRVIPELDACPEPWCSFPYPVGSPDGMIDSSLGCTRFTADLLAAVPDMIDRLPVRDWRRLDCELAPRLRQAGFVPHVHHPAVKHHHVYPAPGGNRCACGYPGGEHDHPC